jgi:2-C-methyl-D-erythritol 4-phosphate cytidylyltransferase
MNGVDKTLAMLGGVPIVARTVEVFEHSPHIGFIVLMVSHENRNAVAELSSQRKWKKVIAVRLGGARRQDTVRLGLQALPPTAQWVMVHDGARPLVTGAVLNAGLAAAQQAGSAIAAVPVKDTIKSVDGTRVRATLDRSSLVHVQTPQVFRRDLLERAHRDITDDVTDDAAMVERLGIPVHTFPGSYANIKITTPDDLAIAGVLLVARET